LVRLFCRGPAEPRADPVPSREQFLIPAWRRRTMEWADALDIWLGVICKRPEIAFIAPARRGRAQMERLALQRCQAARHRGPDGVDQLLDRLEYGPKPRCVVVGDGQSMGAVGRERHGSDRIRMSGEGCYGLAGGRVPQPRGVV